MLVRKGIHIASKCYCCAQVETLDYVFFTNPVAVRVWAHFAGLVGIRHDNLTTLQQVLSVWSLAISTKGHIRQVTPIVILWALWETRNKAKHNSASYSFAKISSRITQLLICNARANMTQSKYWKGDTFMASKLGVYILPQKCKKPTLLAWEKPDKRVFKVGRAAYGGILNDSNGQLAISALQAEVDALLHCLKTTINKGFKAMQIEIDSMQGEEHGCGLNCKELMEEEEESLMGSKYK
ncbi:hypothetical protein Leryth_023870 [Lithospermum erythrorhizon]|nr:hypothetical protein Leryth_023870 [Lithospermum erythrorhizon]